ncbi:hypothetical protein PCC8801_4124 [Rippkaea orientalis PCC 8801]|uniref:Uncharacterized protein n=1 Tax=Rippkaea orientalis (strain PCC 8801 / RF-1) TaxID=41431 RepID=B7K603_RIPO1|nr:hypothetical protein [Rippkaea orientalis]ACK68056.1 hypothetical protein PCC8801_4124 [Rippkaea orientalis PCC 8801]
MSEEALIVNRTGEPYQPARVYYQVSNKKTVLGVFKKLKCMDYEPMRDRWVWLYIAEAKKLRFEISYNKLPKNDPIVLGYFVFRSDQEMLLELRSFERVSAALNFFSPRINWRAAEPTRLRIVNKLFMTSQDNPPSPPNSFDEFFERDNVYINRPELLEQDIIEIQNQYDNEDEKSSAISDYMKQKARKPLPEIEEIPINVHNGGLLVLNMSLMMKHIETWERFQGNENFVMQDLIDKMLADIPDQELDLEED